MMSAQRTARPLTLLLAGVIAVSSPLLLASCSLIPNPVEGVIESVTGGDIALPGSSVPDDFPSEVPLVDGEVLLGAAFGNDSERIWNVTVKVGADAPAEIATSLEGAGFSSAASGTISGDTATLIYEKDGLGVLVVVVEGDGVGEFSANYTVTRSGS